jgi:hypothetical protein
MKSKTLHLVLKGVYFDQIKAGVKTVEYREIKPYWDNRLVGREYDQIKLRRGYQKNAETLLFRWLGYSEQAITHEEFNNGKRTLVYAIDLSQPIKAEVLSEKMV